MPGVWLRPTSATVLNWLVTCMPALHHSCASKRTFHLLPPALINARNGAPVNAPRVVAPGRYFARRRAQPRGRCAFVARMVKHH
ncbi:MAG: hypothetical protein EPN73_03425 [Paraburkholderia sp.]|nr:MAG: hypothetical protein EPN73_03425 [Paraburkholderia sp.]